MRAAPGKEKVIKAFAGGHKVFSFYGISSIQNKKSALLTCLKSKANADCPFYSSQSGYALDIT